MDEKEEFIQTMVSEFLQDVFSDVQSMVNLESGWIFNRVVLFDVRHVKRDAGNRIFIGRGQKKRREPFHNDVKTLFNRLVYDPTLYLQDGFYTTHLCVPASIILCIHAKLGTALRSLTKTKMSLILASFPWQPFIKPGKNGLPLESLTSFEKTLSPIPSKLIQMFPALSAFVGISINIFSIRKKGETRRIFPISLSKHSRNNSFFQADLLLDTSEIRVAPYVPPENHCLAIANLAVLMTRFSDKRQNYRKYSWVCRSCGYCAMSKDRLVDHYSICGTKTRGPLGRRKCNNIIVHRPFLVNRFTKKTEPNGLQFSRGQNYMLLKGTSMIFLDFESYNRCIDGDLAGEMG